MTEYVLYGLAALILVLLIHLFLKWVLSSMRIIPDENYKSLEEIDAMTGREFEDYVAVILEGCGYEIEEMTPATNDYGADIIALAGEERMAIQCKRYARPVGVKAVQEVISAMKHYDCEAAIVITNNKFTKQAYTLADDHEVVTLWDRDDLIELRDRCVYGKG